MTNMKRMISRPWLILITLSVLALLSALSYRLFLHSSAPETLKTEIYRVSGGWGYKILVQEQILIEQPFIPGSPGKKPFPDKRSASRAAGMVKSRMIHGEKPALTREDILELGIDP